MSEHQSSKGKGRGGRAPLTRDAQVSKKMSWLLRHGAEKEGLKLQDGGYLNVSEMLCLQQFKSLKVTLAEVKGIVASNDKQRFTMIIDTSKNNNAGQTSDDPADFLIRANQGHSLKVESDSLLKPVTTDNLPEAAVHGTSHAAWVQIVSSGGLKPMGRNHVHFAPGLPNGFRSVLENGDATVTPPVISGMRSSSTILVFLDLHKALEAGIKIWTSDNGVILTEGDCNGFVPLELLKRVEDRTGYGVLLEDGHIVKEAPANWARKSRAG
ncbi:phosphotransferase KptA/Tpt1 [Polychaeton citri CBS 116435]|uniref:2'-phosphotransferase n=1 Tax=Polychaeton citri CBS 116435 TaxID=1314669 RepID=A0A9P4Q2V7_9PEZI|nr:phosphotransferase KptA/Tpt1 [Polychaeton citri CBS 116435]